MGMSGYRPEPVVPRLHGWQGKWNIFRFNSLHLNVSKELFLMMKDRILLLVLVLLTATAPVVAQQQEQATIQLTIEPAELALGIGEKTCLLYTSPSPRD